MKEDSKIIQEAAARHKSAMKYSRMLAKLEDRDWEKEDYEKGIEITDRLKAANITTHCWNNDFNMLGFGCEEIRDMLLDLFALIMHQEEKANEIHLWCTEDYFIAILAEPVGTHMGDVIMNVKVAVSFNSFTENSLLLMDHRTLIDDMWYIKPTIDTVMTIAPFMLRGTPVWQNFIIASAVKNTSIYLKKNGKLANSREGDQDVIPLICGDSNCIEKQELTDGWL